MAARAGGDSLPVHDRRAAPRNPLSRHGCYLLESEGNYARVYFGKERPLIRRSLNALEGELEPTTFFRADRKRILNLKWIEKVEVALSGGLLVTLRGGRTVEMSRRQSLRLREILSL